MLSSSMRQTTGETPGETPQEKKSKVYSKKKIASLSKDDREKKTKIKTLDDINDEKARLEKEKIYKEYLAQF